MNQMHINLAATCLTMTLGTQAFAYAQELKSEDLSLDQVELIQTFYADTASEEDGICTPPISIALMSLLGLSEDEIVASSIEVACAAN